MKIARLVPLLLALTLIPARMSAHELRPALLRIEQRPDGLLDITWKRPVVGNYAVPLVPHVTGGLIDRPPDVQDLTATFHLKLWRGVDAGPPGLNGRELSIEGLDRTITDVLVSIRNKDGEMRQSILTPDKSKMSIARHPGSGVTVPAYLLLGIQHILTGYDHLAFVLCLTLLVPSRSMLVRTITAFTAAHSITLGLTALGLITVRPQLIEAFVALSVMLVAVELVHLYRGKTPAMARWPWLIALVFGLLHGCAFAGALAGIGVPKNAVLPSLLLFNVGVEIGQLVFVGAILTSTGAIARLPFALPYWTIWLSPYVIGTLAAFWFIDRVQTLLQ